MANVMISLPDEFLKAVDAAFVALAESLRCRLITADRKLHQQLRTLPFVRFLGDVDIPA